MSVELTTAGIVASLGVLFGLNFIGLFVAAYALDRTSGHIVWYLAATVAFIVSGVAFLLSSLTPLTVPFLIIDDLFTGAGFALLGIGFARAFGLDVPWRAMAAWMAVGLVLVPALALIGELALTRLVPVSVWHAIAPTVIGLVLWRAPEGRAIMRVLGAFVLVAALAVLVRPAFSVLITTNPALDHARQVEIYGALVSIPFLVAMFGIAAGVFFHVMSDLAHGYRNASITDALTGLLNRRGFLDAAAEQIAAPAHLIMVDIDRFKTINDGHGHDAGDRVLVAVAAIIARAAPQPHLSGRLGGEEFAIIAQRTETATARALAQSLRSAIAIELDGVVAEGVSVTASLGVAPIVDRDVASALIDADRALYAAKRAGRNAVRTAPDQVASPERRRGSRAG